MTEDLRITKPIPNPFSSSSSIPAQYHSSIKIATRQKQTAKVIKLLQAKRAQKNPSPNPKQQVSQALAVEIESDKFPLLSSPPLSLSLAAKNFFCHSVKVQKVFRGNSPHLKLF
jgi:hypothetical protein